MPQIAAHALLPLAVLGGKRAPQLPDVPAARESGGSLATFYVWSWNGLAAPAKTPAERGGSLEPGSAVRPGAARCKEEAAGTQPGGARQFARAAA